MRSERQGFGVFWAKSGRCTEQINGVSSHLLIQLDGDQLRTLLLCNVSVGSAIITFIGHDYINYDNRGTKGKWWNSRQPGDSLLTMVWHS